MTTSSASDALRVLLIDSYDSFTFNLVQLLSALGARVEVARNDALSLAQVVRQQPDAIVLGPGPGGVEDAGVCVPIAGALVGRVPILGVCLGHQVLGARFGARLERAPAPCHGKVSAIHHDGAGLFAGLESPFEAVRYHSLALAADTIAAPLSVTARSAEGVVMALAHERACCYGLQFHPESALTQHGAALCAAFLERARRHASAAVDASSGQPTIV